MVSPPPPLLLALLLSLLTPLFLTRSGQTGREVNGLLPETQQVSVERLRLLLLPDKFLFGKSGV